MQSPRWQEQAVGAAGRWGAEMCERKMRQPHFRLSASRLGGGVSGAWIGAWAGRIGSPFLLSLLFSTLSLPELFHL